MERENRRKMKQKGTEGSRWYTQIQEVVEGWIKRSEDAKNKKIKIKRRDTGLKMKAELGDEEDEVKSKRRN